MRIAMLLVGLSFTASCAFGQQTATNVQMQCRDLASTGNFVGSDETLVNGMACRVVKTNDVRPPNPSTVTPATTAAVTPVSSSTPPVAPVAATASPVQPVAPGSTRIQSGATVFISPMGGFENYLAAALQKKNVPLVPVANENQAMYVIKGTSEEKKAGWAKILVQGQIHSDDAASIQMFDRQSSAIVFAYAVNKKNTLHGEQTTAEACAKHLKEQIEKK